MLRQVRPAGPPRQLRARIVGATARPRRAWPWIAAAAAALLMTIALQFAAAGLRQQLRPRSSSPLGSTQSESVRRRWQVSARPDVRRRTHDGHGRRGSLRALRRPEPIRKGATSDAAHSHRRIPPRRHHRAAPPAAVRGVEPLGLPRSAAAVGCGEGDSVPRRTDRLGIAIATRRSRCLPPETPVPITTPRRCWSIAPGCLTSSAIWPTAAASVPRRWSGSGAGWRSTPTPRHCSSRQPTSISGARGCRIIFAVDRMWTVASLGRARVIERLDAHDATARRWR